MSIVAIIPARRGSKGLDNKNIQKLSGKTLLEYAILAAKKSKYIDKIVVSTDSPKIKNIAESYGITTPFIRPKKISQDKTPTIAVVKHALNYFIANKSLNPDIIVILQPTSPLRTSELIDKSIKLLKTSKSTSVISVSKVNEHPFGSFYYTGNYLKPFHKNFQKYFQRQKYPNLYYPTGSIYTFWHKTLKKYNSIYGPKIKPLITDFLDVDINNLFELFLCEMILKNWKKYHNDFYKKH